MDRKKFSLLVEEYVRDKRISYLEAIIICCDENALDPIDANKFVSKIIKGKLEAEVTKLNYLKGGNTLPL